MKKTDFAYTPLIGVNAEIAKMKAENPNFSEGAKTYIEAINRDVERDYQRGKLRTLKKGKNN